MVILIFVAAVASVLVNETLEPNSLARSVLNTSWILAPYLVLAAVAVAERRTSLVATAIATLLGAVGALTSVLVVAVFEGETAARFVPFYQAGGIAVLVPD